MMAARKAWMAGAALAAAFAVTGCATEKYVNTHVAAVDTKIDATQAQADAEKARIEAERCGELGGFRKVVPDQQSRIVITPSS